MDSTSFQGTLVLNKQDKTMKKDDPVAKIMTKGVYTIQITDSLADAKDFFHRKKVRHLPVVQDNKLVGMLSLTDIMRLSFGNHFDDQEEVDNAVLEMLSIDQVMKHHPRCVTPDESIREVAKLFTEVEFHALPVIDQNELVGIVSTNDIIRHLLESD